MAKRSFIPTLVKTVHWICVYTAKYNTTIRSFLTEPQLVAFEALTVACGAFLEVIQAPTEADPDFTP